MKRVLSAPPNAEVLGEQAFPFQSSRLLQRRLKDAMKSKEMQPLFSLNEFAVVITITRGLAVELKVPSALHIAEGMDDRAVQGTTVNPQTSLPPRCHHRTI